MACGCPVASSMRGALSEVCAGAALELDPESVPSIAAAIDRLARGEGDVEAGLERAGGYRWERSAAAHVEAYRAALRR
jgi:glycosyltransferase involved in cell wall biosynthesis